MATKIEETLDIIKGMTIVELRDLNSAIEEEFGVTAAVLPSRSRQNSTSCSPTSARTRST